MLVSWKLFSEQYIALSFESKGGTIDRITGLFWTVFE